MATIKGSFDTYGQVVIYEITDEQKDLIMDRLIKYYKTFGHIGECLQQSDEALIEAPDVLSDICDNYIDFFSEE